MLASECENTVQPATPRGVVALVWGVGGFIALLLVAVFRLLPLAAETTMYEWTWAHYVLFAGNLAFMAWCEGYRGFQRSYSPRLAARAYHLYHHATRRQAVLAPLVCMSLLDAPRRRIIAAWLLTVGIVAIVVVYRTFPQPWRGILDAGVVVGLVWGVAATVLYVCRAFRNGPVVNAEMR